MLMGLSGQPEETEGSDQGERDRGHYHDGELGRLELGRHDHKYQEHGNGNGLAQGREFLIHHLVHGVLLHGD